MIPLLDALEVLVPVSSADACAAPVIRPQPWIDPDATLLDLLAERMAQSPGLARLDHRAVDYAEVLDELDVGPGDRVALDLDDGDEALAALLGILAVGAAAQLVAPGVADDLPLAASIGGERPDVPRCAPLEDRRRSTSSIRAWPGADADDPVLVVQWVDDDRQTRVEALDGRTAISGLLSVGDVCGERTEVEGAELLRRLSALCSRLSLH